MLETLHLNGFCFVNVPALKWNSSSPSRDGKPVRFHKGFNLLGLMEIFEGPDTACSQSRAPETVQKVELLQESSKAAASSNWP